MRAVTEACHEVDRRIEQRTVPDTADYFRQQAIVSMAVDQLSHAMDLLARVEGGNGLRESGTFARRQRDFRAMPLHINVHRDRVTHQVGRLALGIDTVTASPTRSAGLRSASIWMPSDRRVKISP